MALRAKSFLRLLRHRDPRGQVIASLCYSFALDGKFQKQSSKERSSRQESDGANSRGKTFGAAGEEIIAQQPIRPRSKSRASESHSARIGRSVPGSHLRVEARQPFSAPD